MALGVQGQACGPGTAEQEAALCCAPLPPSPWGPARCSRSSLRALIYSCSRSARYLLDTQEAQDR